MKKLTVENWKELQTYIDLADYNEYNSNTMTLLMWSNRYEVFFDTFPSFALVYTKMPRMEPVWLMPFCKKEDRRQAMDTIAELSKTEQLPYAIHSMTKEFKDWLMVNYPLQFLVWDCYNARDYVYDRKQQETLSGKKMQKRRNHFHAFEKLYADRYVYQPLTSADIPNILAFLAQWRMGKKEEEQETIDAEYTGIKLLFDHWEKLPLRGGCIYIDGKLEAFNITSRLSKDTVQIHVEKANKQFRGLYIAILKLFLETLDEDILYVNREDDMGLPELRKAKSDMQPIKKIQKFGSCLQPLHIQKADARWESKIKALWESRFADENEASTDFYFQHFYHEEDTWLLTSNQTLISMVQLRPMQIMIRQTPMDTAFLVGVATDNAYEGCGYMKLLLQAVMDKEPYRSMPFLMLQAYQWDIYRSLGFQELYSCCRCKLDKNAYTQQRGHMHPTDDSIQLASLYRQYTAGKEGWRIRDEAYYQTQFLPYAAFWKQQVLLYEEEGHAKGYALCEEQDDHIELLECVYTDADALAGMMAVFAQQDKKVYVHTACDEEIIGRKKAMTTMMVKTQNAFSFPKDNLFISESL